jgi:tetratricopeptide (TPR) repeat protein
VRDWRGGHTKHKEVRRDFIKEENRHGESEMIMGCTRYSQILAIVGCSLLCLTGLSAQEPDEDKGYTPISGIVSPSLGYRDAWALVIGINYEEANQQAPVVARSLVPTLKNAENDAIALKKVLVDLYDYPDDHVVLLQGKDATKEAIEKALNKLKSQAKDDHSVLVFFSGHGMQIDNGEKERGAIYAADVEFTEGGKLNGGYLRMHLDLLEHLKGITAKHRLLVLDCCHSGEIFSLRANASSDADDRRHPSLFEAKNSIQAMASCRDRQKASDGPGNTSPFTAALLQALRRIPARESASALARPRIGVNQLFTYMLPELKNLSNGQNPDCRALGEVDGEFSFFPSTTPEANTEFAKYHTSDNEYRALQAMVPGDHGNWWFEEMPWFIPSLRLMILESAPRSKSGLQSVAISHEELHELAVQLDRDLRKKLTETPDGLKRKLLELRLQHFHSLQVKTAKGSQQVVDTIAREIEALTPLEKEELLASDLHLLAVCKHYLQRKTRESDQVEAVDVAYNEALERFDVTQPNELTLKALCHADYGLFLSSVKRDYPNAAAQYHNALSLFGSDLTSETPTGTTKDRAVLNSAPAAFRAFVLCSEASAWQQQSRWGKANDLLRQALLVAKGFDQDHELMVFVLNQYAWAQMVQWRIDEAAKHFERANQILLKIAKSTDDASEVDLESKSQQFNLMLGYDYTASARYLHHLHGLAMAKRFRGQREEAISEYREIVRMIAIALDHLKHDKLKVISSDVETTLLTRLENSQERLADCNLFGNPANPDLQEAADDYRRALSACAFLASGDSRDGIRMKLLYKLSLALSIPSVAQDITLASAYSQEAGELRAKLKIRPDEPDGTLGLVTEAIVAVFALPNDSPTQAAALDKLRLQIHELRDLLRSNVHRDQLEVLLLASKILVDHVPDVDRYHLSEDVELLLYFCRQILPRSSSSLGDAHPQQETCSYLRAYYDTAMRNKLRMKPTHVKDLIELQWEATSGEFYTKPTEPHPVLALYLLDDKCYLLLDMPDGASKLCCLEGKYYVSSLTRACIGEAEPLPLPDEIQQELVKLAKQHPAAFTPFAIEQGIASDSSHQRMGSQSALELRWADPTRGLPSSFNAEESPAEGPSTPSHSPSKQTFASPEGDPSISPDGVPHSDMSDSPLTVTTRKLPSPRFPFLIPSELSVAPGD